MPQPLTSATSPVWPLPANAPPSKGRIDASPLDRPPNRLPRRPGLGRYPHLPLTKGNPVSIERVLIIVILVVLAIWVITRLV